MAFAHHVLKTGEESFNQCTVKGLSLIFVASSISSPIGEIFRSRLRQFPSLVNCCTIDWFNEWPAEALESVAFSFLQEIPDPDATPEVIEGMVGASL